MLGLFKKKSWQHEVLDELRGNEGALFVRLTLFLACATRRVVSASTLGLTLVMISCSRFMTPWVASKAPTTASAQAHQSLPLSA